MKPLALALSCFAIGIVVGGVAVKMSLPEPPQQPASKEKRNTPVTALPRSSTGSYRTADGGGVDISRLDRMSPAELYQHVEHLDGRSLLDLLHDLGKQPLDIRRISTMQGTIVVRLAQLDPDAALRFVRKDGNNSHYFPVIEAIAKHDLEKALSVLNGTTDKSRYSQTANVIMRTGVAGSAVAIIALIESGDHVYLWSDGARNIGRTFDHTNVDEGLALMEKFTGTDAKTSFLHALLTNVAAGDPQRALQIFEAHGQSRSQRTHLLKSLVSGWLRTDVEGARSWFETLTRNSDRTTVLASFLNNGLAGATHREWIANQLFLLPDGTKGAEGLAASLAKQIGKADPMKGLEWIRQLPPGVMRTSLARSSHGAINGMAVEWARKDPQAALAYIQGFDKEDVIYDELARSTIRALSWADPLAGAEQAVQLEGRARTMALSDVVERWAKTDPTAAETWIDGLTRHDGRLGALNAFIKGVAEHDPEHAARTLQRVTQGHTENSVLSYGRAIDTITETWAQNDPKAAADWALEIPNGEPGIATSAVIRVLETWAKHEPKEVSEWLTAVPAGEKRDVGIEVLLDKIKRSDPASAFAWASVISDPVKQANELREAVFYWRDKDSAAARAAVDAASVSDEVRLRLLGVL